MAIVFVEQGVVNQLEASTGLTGICGLRIYAEQAPEDAALPYVTYQRISIEPLKAMRCSAGAFTTRLQVDCWSETTREARSMAYWVRKALDGFMGSMGEGTTTYGITFEDERDLSEPPIAGESRGVRRVSQDFMVRH